jgi:DNA-binding CsgD family transcriptional regulator
MLRSAVEVLEGSPAQLELARALVDYGAALRRASHKVASRSPLRRGLELAASLGAKPLAQRAHDELRAAGGRRGAPRDKFGPGALTPAERRVAELAASGLSTPQLARRLHVSAKTVDWHLGHVYQKLGIGSRRQLQSSLAQKPRRV